jgi:hypothetical protein
MPTDFYFFSCRWTEKLDCKKSEKATNQDKEIHHKFLLFPKLKRKKKEKKINKHKLTGKLGESKRGRNFTRGGGNEELQRVFLNLNIKLII